jgi:hypothetical protein
MMGEPMDRRVAFGLGKCEPTLRVVEADGLMNIYWGEIPLNSEAEHSLSEALAASGIHAWLQSLFHENESRLPMTSELSGPCFGSWIDCPADIGEKVVDIMSIFLKQTMLKIIPTLGFDDDA